MMALRVTTALLAVFALCWAEPEAPRFRGAGYGAPVEEAPYPPSGWRPSGRQFFLPVRQSNNYNTYYAPPPAYGAPITTEQPSTTEQPTTTEVPTTTEDASNEFADGNGQDPSQVQGDNEQASGVYYVLLPDGRLQRVAYTSVPQQQQQQQRAEYGVPAEAAQPHGLSAGYVAQVQYQDVEPIRAPIYTFSAPLVRIFKK